MKKIFVVEDDESICQELVQILENEGYEAESLKNFDNTKDDILKAAPNLVLMDINIPGINGRNLVKEIRKESDVPIIMVTSRTSEMDEVLSMSYGADDYITKPFLPGELIARIKANLRRSRANSDVISQDTVIRAGILKIDPQMRNVFLQECLIPLTAKEFDILLLLAQNPKRIFSAEQLFKIIWKTTSLNNDPKTVTVHMSALRKKIETSDNNEKYIINIRGVGYKFNHKLLEEK